MGWPSSPLPNQRELRGQVALAGQKPVRGDCDRGSYLRDGCWRRAAVGAGAPANRATAVTDGSAGGRSYERLAAIVPSIR